MDKMLDQIIGANLHSFRNSQQFLELEFSNELYDKIIFFIDCEITCSNDKISRIVSDLRLMDEDVCDIAYFIPVNNHNIDSVVYDVDSLMLKFDNGYCISFLLEEDYGRPLSIAFKKKQNDDYNSIVFPNASTIRGN